VPIQTALASETRLAIDRTTHTITLKRTIAAPRDQVFEAWTRPEHVACWWDPTGARLSECDIDLRPGGSFRFVSAEHGHPFTGTYRLIASPEKLVFDALGAVGTVDLEEACGKTFMTVTIKCGSLGHLEQFLQMGVEAGTGQTLDNLVNYMEAVRQPTVPA
jgi:uncharacterized protein YndB with AHSA1/START domain